MSICRQTRQSVEPFEDVFLIWPNKDAPVKKPVNLMGQNVAPEWPVTLLWNERVNQLKPSFFASTHYDIALFQHTLQPTPQETQGNY